MSKKTIFCTREFCTIGSRHLESDHTHVVKMEPNLGLVPEEPKQKTCECYCHYPKGMIRPANFRTCEHCQPEQKTCECCCICHGVCPENDTFDSCDHCEPEQKACICVDYCYTVGGDYECKEECLFCHPDYKPDPSLNTWEKLYRDTWEGANVWSSKAIDEQIEFIASQITLAIQKERERATKEIIKFDKEKRKKVMKADNKPKKILYIWCQAQEEFTEDILPIISNKGVEEK